MIDATNIKIAKLGEKVLRKKAKKVKDIKSEETKEIISIMIDTLKKSNGVGLAAPQISISKQIMIISSKPNDRYPNAPLMQELVLINPQIIKTSKGKNRDWEGCLSIPGIRARVPRFNKIKVKYKTLDDEEKTIVFKDFVARIFQHEYDHLIGLAYIDRVVSNKMTNIEKLAKILKEELIPELDENLEEIMDIIDSGDCSKDDKDELKYLEEMKAYFDEVELDIANNNLTEEDALDILEVLEEMRLDKE
jgi:peptide deformylase